VSLRDATALVVLVAVAVGALSVIVFSLKLGISPLPTSAQVRVALLSLVPGDTAGEVHELGAGWGGLALSLARHCPRAKVVAWERSWLPWAVTWSRARLARAPNLEVRRADFLAADLGQASVLVCYLFTGGMRALDEKLRRERPGAAVSVVTNTFLLHGWPPERVLTVDDLYRTKVARYARVPGAPTPRDDASGL